MRLLGIDRSGPRPEATRRGQPLRPFTVPNAIGLARLVAIPAFLVVALQSGDGRSAAATALFCFVAAGDYLDGLAARITGQYSRLGALMDPLLDRLTILAGAVVAWHFELLPHWAIAALVARELVMLVIAQWGLRRGVDLQVNWPGRIAVLPIMSSFPLAMITDTPVAAWLLVAGVGLASWATVLYVRTGITAQR